MSRLAEFRAAEKALAEQLAHLESLKNDAGLKKEIQFETELNALLSEYGKTLRDVVAILDPESGRGPRIQAGKGSRRARVLKVYRNPHTGEVVETKGGNHAVLKAWKAEHGAEAVESWLQR
ncbi:histone-like nucleoid-structuring protein, MvaT/MvaU family [Pseudomonas nitroreducens]|uniref:histone-like nucleoid-structuring protein, MvaT/MvaU family n=1 Tax=Pseudomonas nitroreducens TaxID=46680 RepID=UPI001876B8E0|nr:histone-like nucleoid-structuring protein, MvaT/MvaU family [Pseudomonas nitritireducens]